MNPPEPRLERICSARVLVEPPEVIGVTPMGERRVVRIKSGRFEGRISGHVMPGGADYQVIASDGTSYLDARYVIQTDDGALIVVRNLGIRHGTIGDDPSKYYFRSTPRFECADERYLWLNKIIAICSAARTPDNVILDFYQVL